MTALLIVAVSCQQEDIQLHEEQNVKGRIVLALSGIEVYTSDAPTRATLNDYTGFVFTLNGTTVGGWTVRDSDITFTNNAAIIEAGNYSLSANNDAASLVNNGCANYRGTTAQNFNLAIGYVDKALGLSSYNPRAYFVKGMCYMAAKQDTVSALRNFLISKDLPLFVISIT